MLLFLWAGIGAEGVFANGLDQGGGKSENQQAADQIACGQRYIRPCAGLDHLLDALEEKPEGQQHTGQKEKVSAKRKNTGTACQFGDFCNDIVAEQTIVLADDIFDRAPRCSPSRIISVMSRRTSPDRMG